MYQVLSSHVLLTFSDPNEQAVTSAQRELATTFDNQGSGMRYLEVLTVMNSPAFSTKRYFCNNDARESTINHPFLMMFWRPHIAIGASFVTNSSRPIAWNAISEMSTPIESMELLITLSDILWD